MLVDEDLEYIIYPKEIVVSELKDNLRAIFLEIEKASGNRSYILRYKSITRSYGAHRRDSEQFHFLLNNILRYKNLARPNSRTASLLKKEDLKHFKRALYFLDIDCQARGKAFVAHLWAIALKASKKRVNDAIKEIWKKRQGIHRMNQKAMSKFTDFYSHLA
ncbi:hypothetical protein EAW55_10230 [Legionella jordanis]|nr:hypothetical protein EAW55_10230 [Legionella jordanis]RMX17735.1 hypothetical protein EAS68_10245 [Legionella jordanis]HAT8714693.1 hypothetical protein [Legionella jordanis]